jgi:tetratricopeptide (TPR) repeat protein
VTANDFLYIIHNLHMQTNNAMLAGLSSYSVKSARETTNSIPRDYLGLPGALGNYVQYIHMTPMLVDVRFGNWSDLLLQPQPDHKQIYSNILYHFGRGMALSNQSRMAEAKYELERIEQLMTDTSLRIPLSPFSAAIEGVITAKTILAGTIALKENRFNDAIHQYRIAVDTEDKMVYNEPRDWLLNPKHYLGNAYNQAGQYTNAKEIFEKDLANNNENPWALFGLAQALKGEKNTVLANKVMLRYAKASKAAGIKLTAAVY